MQQKFEQRRIGRQDQRRLLVDHFFVDFEGAKEPVKLLLSPVGIGVNLGRIRLSGAALALGLGLGGRHRLGGCAIGLGDDFLRFGIALGTIGVGDALAFGPHPREDGHQILIGEIKSGDAKVDDLDPKV